MLYRRTAETSSPAACLAVWKATRGFDSHVYESAALGAHLGYDLPKKAVKSGVDTVEVTLTDKQVELFFPDPTHRRIQRGRATFYDLIMPYVCYMLGYIAGYLFFLQYYEPQYTTWQYVMEIIAALLQYVLMLPRGITAVLFIAAAIGIFAWLALFKMMLPVIGWRLACMMNIKVSAPVIISGAVSGNDVLNSFVGAWTTTTQEMMCSQYRHVWLCPAAPATYFDMLWNFLVFIFWDAIPLVGSGVVWQAAVVFYATSVFLRWLLRRRTVWKVQLKIESQALSIARDRTTRAQQETISDKVAATPILSQVDSYIKSTHQNMPVTLREKYCAICLMVASGWAAHRVRLVNSTKSEPDTEPVQDTAREALGQEGGGKRLLKTRNNTAPHNTWRESVRVKVKSWFQLHDDVQKGQDRTLPGADEVKERYSGVVTGPELFDITEGFEGSKDDEVAGVSRHLRRLKSTISGEYLEPPTDEAEARLNRATDIICDIVSTLARIHMLSLLSWSLPKKWGPTRDIMYQRVSEVCWTVITYSLTGFCKLCELALPLNKLPRLVGSMGMLACAKDAALISCVELLFKKFLPHLVVKGKTQDGVCSRFAAFARRAKLLGRKIVSIDMSAMDSSWTESDRARVRRVMRAIIDQLQGLLDAELQDDYVKTCSAKKRLLRWFLKYIIVELKAADAILFSGERGTSIGNRILMLITWGAELLRVYGEQDGKDKIERMFYCPTEMHETGTDERPSGQAMAHGYEVKPYEDKFPAHPDMDNNIGDGDDCTLTIRDDMYASEEDFIKSWEAYYKLVEPCSAWTETTDMECLSMMVIFVGEEAYFVPKVARNIQRLVAHKITIPPGKRIAEGNSTFEPSVKQYAEIATDLWQRSYNLRNSMVTRHLNRAMFEYCFSKCGNHGTVYDDDQKRLGKVDGDVRLGECLEAVRQNTYAKVHAWVMVKATHFRTIHTLTAPQVKALKAEWYEADDVWSQLELTDELCAHPDVLLDSYPIGVNVAKALGFKREYQELLIRKKPHWVNQRMFSESPQLVKGEQDPPEMRGRRPAGGDEDSVPDGFFSIVYAGSTIVYKEPTPWLGLSIACGYEPEGKPRKGMLMVPTGKLEREETYLTGAMRELAEEGRLCADPGDFTFVRDSVLGKCHTRQFCVPYAKTRPSTVLTADYLDDFKFRTAFEIVNEHAPSKIGSCIKDIIDFQNYKFTFLQNSTPRLQGCIGLVGKVDATKNPAVSASQHRSCEVKATPAEGGVTGPSTAVNFEHSHVCPVCATEIVHAHPHNPLYNHKMRKGECTNPVCSMHKSPQKRSADAITSSEPGKVRHSQASSPVNDYGTAHLRKGAGKGKTYKTPPGLAPPVVSKNACKSNAAPAESKEGTDLSLVQTAAAAMTRVSEPKPNVPIKGELSRDSEGRIRAMPGSQNFELLRESRRALYEKNARPRMWEDVTPHLSGSEPEDAVFWERWIAENEKRLAHRHAHKPQQAGSSCDGHPERRETGNGRRPFFLLDDEWNPGPGNH